MLNLSLKKAMSNSHFKLTLCSILPVIFFVISQIIGQLNSGSIVPLGWDQPNYVYEANNVGSQGFSYMPLHQWNLYHSFYLLISVFGLPFSDNKIGLFLFELICGVLYTVLITRFTYEINRSYVAAFIAGLVSVLSVNFVRLMILPRQIFVLILCIVLLLQIGKLSTTFSLRSLKSWGLVGIFVLIFWWSAANGILMVIILLSYSILRRHKGLFVFSGLSLLLGMAPSVIVLLSSMNVYAISGPMPFTINISAELLTSLLSTWLGGSFFLFALTVSGFLLLWYKSFRTTNSFALLASLWGISSLVLFIVACLGYSYVADWLTYAERALLVFPTSIAIAQTLYFVFKFVMRRVSGNEITV